MQLGDYIRTIEIDALWNGQRHVIWHLTPDVNILSGVNGVGKSTILNKVVKYLLNINKINKKDDGITLTFYPEGSSYVNFDVIRSFDRPMVSSDLLNIVTDAILQSELDFYLYQLQRKYLDYQVNLSNRMVELYTNNVPNAHEKAQKIAYEKTFFQDMVAYSTASTAPLWLSLPNCHCGQPGLPLLSLRCEGGPGVCVQCLRPSQG